jgi:hypothetical protein
MDAAGDSCPVPEPGCEAFVLRGGIERSVQGVGDRRPGRRVVTTG